MSKAVPLKCFLRTSTLCFSLTWLASIASKNFCLNLYTSSPLVPPKGLGYKESSLTGLLRENKAFSLSSLFSSAIFAFKISLVFWTWSLYLSFFSLLTSRPTTFLSIFIFEILISSNFVSHFLDSTNASLICKSVSFLASSTLLRISIRVVALSTKSSMSISTFSLFSSFSVFSFSSACSIFFLFKSRSSCSAFVTG